MTINQETKTVSVSIPSNEALRGSLVDFFDWLRSQEHHGEDVANLEHFLKQEFAIELSEEAKQAFSLNSNNWCCFAKDGFFLLVATDEEEATKALASAQATIIVRREEGGYISSIAISGLNNGRVVSVKYLPLETDRGVESFVACEVGVSEQAKNLYNRGPSAERLDDYRFKGIVQAIPTPVYQPEITPGLITRAMVEATQTTNGQKHEVMLFAQNRGRKNRVPNFADPDFLESRGYGIALGDSEEIVVSRNNSDESWSVALPRFL